MSTNPHLRLYTVLLDCGCFLFTDDPYYGLTLEGGQPYGGYERPEYCPVHGEQEWKVVVLNGAGFIEVPRWE